MGVLARGRTWLEPHRTAGPVEVEWIFTDRTSGHSAPPYDQANLGTHVGDSPEAVAANRSGLAQALDVAPGALVTMNQVHGREVAIVDASCAADSAPIQADALITAQSGLVLVTQVADCVPVLLASPEGLIGAVHSGWRGVVAGVVDAAVEALVAEGAPATTMRAWVGPSICAGCYEVGEQVREQVASAAPAAYAETRWGTAAVDVGAGVAEQLARHGVAVETIAGCTAEDDRLFSYRRDGRTGRQAGAIMMRMSDR